MAVAVASLHRLNAQMFRITRFPLRPSLSHIRSLKSSIPSRESDHGFRNMFDDVPPSTIQVKTMTESGIELTDGLLLPSSCIFLGGKVFLWEVPGAPWSGWSTDHFKIFEIVIPKPEILLLGTGKSVLLPPPSIRSYLNQIGVQIDVLDTRNACSTYNVLVAEGRRVAAALVPPSTISWKDDPAIISRASNQK